MKSKKWYSCPVHINRNGPAKICLNDNLPKDAVASDPMDQTIDEFYAQLKKDMIEAEKKDAR